MTETPLQIRFGDVDSAGHVHNSVYLHYFELGRIDFFISKVAGEDWDWTGTGLILARNEIDYFSPLFLRNKPSVRTTLNRVGNKSIVLDYEIFEEDTIFAKGSSVLVCYDYTLNTTIRVPDDWRRKLSAL